MYFKQMSRGKAHRPRLNQTGLGFILLPQENDSFLDQWIRPDIDEICDETKAV